MEVEHEILEKEIVNDNIVSMCVCVQIIAFCLNLCFTQCPSFSGLVIHYVVMTDFIVVRAVG